MLNVRALIDDHKALFLLAQDMKDLVREHHFSTEKVCGLLRELCASVESHLDAEERLAYAEEMRTSRIKCEHEIALSEEAYASLIADWKQYVDDWCPRRVDEDRWSFRTATLWIMDRMQQRIQEENGILYPMALQLQARAG